MAYPGATACGDSGLPPPRYCEDLPVPPITWHIPQKERPMMKHQGSLPRLPVPPLEQTLSMYLHSVKPLCTEEEWTRTKMNVMNFLTSPISQELQDRLVRKAAEKGDSSWLVDWWNELCYLAYRDPVVIWVSYFFEFIPDRWSGMRQTYRAAALAKAALRYRHLVRSETLPCEMSGKNPMDMSMYNFLFNSSRIPHPGKDYYVTFDKYFYNHIIVLSRGRIYSVELGAAKQELSIAQIEQQLQRIVEASAGVTDDESPPVGVLTTGNRDEWAKNRAALREVAGNAALLEAIDTAALVICLDEAAPLTSEERCRNLWHGDGRNRWFDKPMQFVVASNGHAGLVGEHALMDGQPTTACSDWILRTLAAPNGPKSVDSPAAAHVEPFRRLDFKLPKESPLAQSFASFNKLIGSQELRVVEWKKFGKNELKKLRVSPDAFCQMAIQLAYKRLHGNFAATYEAASVRMYLHGRTETVRSCHIPGANFVSAMDDPKATDKQRYAMLRKAAEYQSWFTKRAVKGHGCDRHLMGLKLACKPEEMPEIFKDPIYTRSNSWVLSTSALASDHLSAWGFGEVVPHGYGLGYLLNRDWLTFVVTSLKSHPVPAGVYQEALQKALGDMYAMCVAALTASNPKL